MINEARAGRVQSDVWCMVDGVTPLLQANLIGEFEVPSAKGLPAELVDPKKRWVAINLGVRSAAYNTNARSQGAGATQLSGPARPALEGQDGLEPEIDDRRLGFHLDRDQGHGRRATAWPICARSPSRMSCRCRSRSAPCSIA